MRPFFLALALCAALCPLAAASDFRRFEDAALHAVQFWDKNEGWAVGDEGAIWHTIDGGQSWERQPTGVRSSLRSLQFLNPYVGWVVGREELPGGGSTGTILYTRDGGLKWQSASRNTLPGLQHVRFVDDRTGFVVGDGTDQFPTGVFATRDGGRTWQPIAGPRCPGWLAADFTDAKNGVLVGCWNRLATLQDGALGTADVDALGGRSVRGLYSHGKQIVAVGQGGLILKSETGGAKWGFVDPKLTPELRACWDFHTVHGRGEHIWVAGRPGSAMLHSADQGKTWALQKTGQALPLNGVFFIDDKLGWAVGELGCIVGTVDGGETWKVQRRGGIQAALLFVHARSSELPTDTLAQLGAADGYLAAALCVTAPDTASAAPARATQPQRWQAAVGRSGGAAAESLWQFPLPQHFARADRATVMKFWDGMHGNHAAEQMLRQMVLALRTWQPSVVVTDHPDPAVSGYPVDSLIAEAIHEAFARAADPKAFPEQIQTLGLEPWQPKKLYGIWDNRGTAKVVYDTTQICQRLEETYRGFATPAAALLTDRTPPVPSVRLYQLLDSKLAGASEQDDLMTGIALAWGGAARREAPEPPKGNAQSDLLHALAKCKTLEALAESQPGGVVDPEKLMALLGPTIASLPDEQAAAAAYGIASQYARQGQWLLAREIFLLMADSYPAHPRTADAYRWLVHYSCSSEARRRQELGQFMLVSNLSFQPSSGKNHIEGARVKVDAKGPGQDQVQDATLSHLRDLKETRAFYEGGLKIGDRLAACGPLYGTDPSLHFCLQSAKRNLGQLEEASEWYTKFRDGHGPSVWRDAAASECWLRDRSNSCPKPIAPCRQASLRPFLDGEFDDPCWQGQKKIVLRNAVGDTLKEYPTEVMLSFDSEYLYVAIRCKHPPERFVPPVKVRKRDEDLRPFDRVSLLIDLDRDYATYYRLEIDQRGCLCEDCWGDRTWNPKWFVAMKCDKECWQAEAAIPLAELTGERVTVGKAWACNLVRVLPGRGVQALSLPADVEPRPEGMGLMLFAPEPA
ncbi:hypothetical protein AYO40_03775, partial [Planctomycetaceae bacterium SCGC AG-212-D15]